MFFICDWSGCIEMGTILNTPTLVNQLVVLTKCLHDDGNNLLSDPMFITFSFFFSLITS